MKTLILILLAITASAADAPVLTDKQKLAVREAQISVLGNRAEISELESRLKDLYQQRPMLQKNFEDTKAKATPAGWNMQPDLTLAVCKWADEPGCGVRKEVAKQAGGIIGTGKDTVTDTGSGIGFVKQ